NAIARATAIAAPIRTSGRLQAGGAGRCSTVTKHRFRPGRGNPPPRAATIGIPRAVSSVGRAPARQAGGHWFEPSTAHVFPLRPLRFPLARQASRLSPARARCRTAVPAAPARSGAAVLAGPYSLSSVPSTPEEIKVGEVRIRFLVEGSQAGGAVAVFEAVVPTGARVPVAHSHDGYEETIYGLEGVLTWTVEGTSTD